ncbi:hypothetical protein BDV93DRAFT_601331 [Ceratobasidium sp. AG-I]|nr:hypothetical protein BDV93DRAFT_601331 [Ceratobasidium sp. AG-I]
MRVIASSFLVPFEYLSMTTTRIQRGYACVPCHSRKKRCDGLRPSCSSCSRSRIQCEYAPLPAETSGQGQVRALMARVDELEHMLATMSGSSPPGSVQGHNTEPLAVIPASGLPAAAPLSPLIDPVSREIPEWLQGVLINTMIANRRRYSLYHNVSFLQSPPQPLLNAMNLVACHILTASAGPDTQPTLQDLEYLKPMLLSMVYAGVHTSLENAQDLLAGAVCGPALAAQYLLEVGRFAKAHWLAGSAVRFAISSGLHTIASHQWTPENVDDMSQSPDIIPLAPSSSFLVPPRDAQEQHDRLMAWWLAYTADGLIEVVAGLPSTLRAEILVCLGDMEANLEGFRAITAVFPLPEGMNGSGPYGPEVSSTSILDLLSQDSAFVTAQDGSSRSVFAMRLKAITVYHAVVSVNDSCHSTGRLLDHSMSSRIFACISAFVEQLPSLSFRELPGSPSEHAGLVNLDVVVAYMLAHTATIRLYANSMSGDDQKNRLSAALAIAHLVTALDGEEVRAQTQVLMTCCSDALEVLSSEDNIQHAGSLESRTLTSFIERLRV